MRLAHQKWSRGRKKVPRVSFPELPFGCLWGSPVFHAFSFPTATALTRQARRVVGAVFRLERTDYFVVTVVLVVQTEVQQKVDQVMLAAIQQVRAGAVGVSKGFLSPANRHLEVEAKHLSQRHVCRVASVHPICQRLRPDRGWRVFSRGQSIRVLAARTMVLDCLKWFPED